MSIVFKGVLNGRPVFDYPGEVPPAWLRDIGFSPVADEAGKPVLKLRGKSYRVGDELLPTDFRGGV